MNLTNILDLAIKAAEKGSTDGGYLVGERLYDTYMTRDEWIAFQNAMPAQALAEFGAGSGDELSEKSGKPPKMASYGSSSRLIYMLSHHKEGFCYEKKLPTTVGGVANLDGFLDDGHRYVFVEAKCHEPYTTKNVSVSKSYEALYGYINDCMAGSLEIKMQPSKCGRYLNVAYFADGERLEHFDMKQMICHLLGIATGILKGELEQKQIDFIYLFYDPTELDLPEGAKEAIYAIYERTCYECNLVDFATLFRIILAFLSQTKYREVMDDDALDGVAYTFTFALTSQELYPLLLDLNFSAEA